MGEHEKLDGEEFHEGEYEEEDGAVVGHHSSLLSNSTYDVLRNLARIWIPAFGTLYFTIAQIWGLPNAEETVGTIVAVDTFLGVLLNISSSSYKQATEGPTVGFLDVTQHESGIDMLLQFPGDPHKIKDFDKVTFKVRKR